jgi:2-oxo-4-hydroxy-4-carboxy-5-ureidoimidazoline decarboxylase
MEKLSLETLNALAPGAFVSLLGGIYEHSPWVAGAVVGKRPFAASRDLIDAMRAAVDQADESARLALIRAHPDLAGKLAIAGKLSEASAGEQAGLGLDRLSPDEFARFQEMNSAYRARHGFPFVICARLTDKPGILEAFARRTRAETCGEAATAISEIHQIARLRLLDLLE